MNFGPCFVHWSKSVQTGKVPPPQTRSSMSLWTLICALAQIIWWGGGLWCGVVFQELGLAPYFQWRELLRQWWWTSAPQMFWNFISHDAQLHCGVHEHHGKCSSKRSGVPRFAITALGSELCHSVHFVTFSIASDWLHTIQLLYKFLVQLTFRFNKNHIIV